VVKIIDNTNADARSVCGS